MRFSRSIDQRLSVMVGFAILVFPPAALLRLLEQVQPRGRGFPFSSLPWTVGHEELKSEGCEGAPEGRS